ncbi:MAG: hypothetical protein H7Z40_00795 [Phycisphaerae bacterium]|nr:hypothetical protein [Gemmatimonadaceae bacterium]
MIGQSRPTSSLAASLRTPYASPRPTTTSHAPQGTGPSQLLVPFVPREFREQARRTVTVLPAAPIEIASRPQDLFSPNYGPDAVVDEVSAHFGSTIAPDDGLPANTESTGIDAVDAGTLETDASAELPWIEAFAADEAEAEETWPLGEAGKRLDELTESLSSLDASRARLEATPTGSSELPFAAEPALPMWNEDEWIDIMPTSPRTPLETVAEVPIEETFSAEFAAEDTAHIPTAEITARALESLAQRVRSGEVQVPEAQPDVAQEALLARVLAAMLGWRQ